MILTDNYIFLLKDSRKMSKKDGVIQIQMNKKISSIFKEEENFIKSKKEGSTILNRSYTYSYTKLNTIVVITEKHVKDDIYLTVDVKGKKIDAIKVFSEIKKQLFSLDYSYDIVHSYDNSSQYFCTKVYPKISILERNLRRLFLNVYTLTYSNKYIDIFDEKFINSIKSKVQAKGNKENKRISLLQNFFDSFTMAEMIDFLFLPQYTKDQEIIVNDTLSDIEKLYSLSTSDLTDIILSCSPRSNWNRFFEKKFHNVEKGEMKDALNEIRDKRNNVAHAKSLSEEEYKILINTINKINKKVEKAIKITEEKDFYEKNMEIIDNLNKSLSYLQNLVTKINFPIL